MYVKTNRVFPQVPTGLAPSSVKFILNQLDLDAPVLSAIYLDSDIEIPQRSGNLGTSNV